MTIPVADYKLLMERFAFLAEGAIPGDLTEVPTAQLQSWIEIFHYKGAAAVREIVDAQQELRRRDVKPWAPFDREADAASVEGERDHIGGGSKTNYTVAPGDYVTEWIEEHDLTVDEFAERAGLSVEQVQAILDGGPVTGQTGPGLAKVTGIPVWHWFALTARYIADVKRLTSKGDGDG